MKNRPTFASFKNKALQNQEVKEEYERLESLNNIYTPNLITLIRECKEFRVSFDIKNN